MPKNIVLLSDKPTPASVILNRRRSRRTFVSVNAVMFSKTSASQRRRLETMVVSLELGANRAFRPALCEQRVALLFGTPQCSWTPASHLRKKPDASVCPLNPGNSSLTRRSTRVRKREVHRSVAAPGIRPCARRPRAPRSPIQNPIFSDRHGTAPRRHQ